MNIAAMGGKIEIKRGVLPDPDTITKRAGWKFCRCIPSVFSTSQANHPLIGPLIGARAGQVKIGAADPPVDISPCATKENNDTLHFKLPINLSKLADDCGSSKLSETALLRSRREDSY